MSNIHRNSHTHCQAPQADAKAKACQRVCLSNARIDWVTKTYWLQQCI